MHIYMLKVEVCVILMHSMYDGCFGPDFLLLKEHLMFCRNSLLIVWGCYGVLQHVVHFLHKVMKLHSKIVTVL